MSEQSPAGWFAGLSVPNKTIVLSKIVYEFTIVIRDVTYSPPNVAGVRAIQGVGELTHLITLHLIALHQGDDNRFADDDLINLLFAAAADYGLEKTIQRAWRSAPALLPRS
jgi:hypothetical protein